MGPYCHAGLSRTQQLPSPTDCSEGVPQLTPDFQEIPDFQIHNFSGFGFEAEFAKLPEKEAYLLR